MDSPIPPFALGKTKRHNLCLSRCKAVLTPLTGILALARLPDFRQLASTDFSPVFRMPTMIPSDLIVGLRNHHLTTLGQSSGSQSEAAQPN